MYNVCALVTVFYPTQIVVKNISILESQVTCVLIMDNTPNTNNSNLFLNKSGKVFYLANQMNYGLSKAFNEGLKYDNAKKADFILFLDQDSLLPEDLVNKLIHDYNRILKREIKIGCIGPIYYEENADKLMIPKIKRRLLSSIYEVDSIMTSSMLTTYSALSQINFWNEKIFLDLADWDLCWRFKSIGLKCCLTQNVVLRHKLGVSLKRIGGLSVKEGSPVREYYQTRDCLKLLLKDYTPLKYKIKFILMITIRPIIHILILPEKYLRIKFILLGIIDFFRSKNGPFDLRKTNV
jgi:rhamnosyltransferase